jgi:rhomboid protease GluP
MVIYQDYLFWRLIENLVIQKHFRLVNLTSDHHEVWLEPANRKDFQLIRLKRFDIDWSNWIAQDLDASLSTFESIRKQSYKSSLNILNVYISTYEPVDEWRHIVQRPLTKGRTALKTIFIDKEHKTEGIVSLEEALSVSFATLLNHLEFYHVDQMDYEQLNKIKHTVVTFANQQIRQEREIFERGKPFFTYIFLGVQMFMFLVLELFGGSTNTNTLIFFGAKVNELIYQGEWWRLITPIFLHIGFLHLLMNSFALYYIGTTVEKMYGSWRFLFIYLFAGIIGSFLSFVFSPAISAGASGSIFGLFGSLLLLGIMKPNLFFRTIGPNILIVIAINLALGFTIPNVDNAGHIGGLMGGFIAALIVQLPKMSRLFLRLVGVIISIGLVYGLFYYSFYLGS